MNIQFKDIRTIVNKLHRKTETILAVMLMVIITITILSAVMLAILCGVPGIEIEEESIDEKKIIKQIEAFEKYCRYEEKSYSREPEKVNTEKDYKLSWELLSAIDKTAGDKNLTERTFNALRSNFIYKESIIKKETTEKQENPLQEGKNEVIKKVLLPIEIDTYYKKIIFEYETKTLVERHSSGSLTAIADVIEKEVLKEGYPIEVENVTSRFLPYLESIGIKEKTQVISLIEMAKRKSIVPNKGLEYVDTFIR